MRGAPVGNGVETLAFVARELEINLTGRYHLDVCGLHDRDRLIVVAQKPPTIAWLRQRILGVRRKVGGQAGRGYLLAAQDGVDSFRRSSVRA